MGRHSKHKKHKHNRHDESSDSSSSYSSRSESSNSSASDSSSDSEHSIKYYRDKSQKRKTYNSRSKRQTKDVEDDFNMPTLPKKNQTLLQQQHRNQSTPQKGNGRVNSKSMRVIPMNDNDDGIQVPANTRRTKKYDKKNTVVEQQIADIEGRSRTKSQNLDGFNFKPQSYQLQKQQQIDDQQDSFHTDQMMNLRKKPLRRESQRALLVSNHSLASNNGSVKGSVQVLSPQNGKQNQQQFQNSSINFIMNQTHQQHHISNFARIQPINTSMNNSMNGVLNNSHNITINANQQENQPKENEQDLLKLEIKNKELNRIQTQQRQALNNLTQNLKRKQSIDNIEFVNKEKEKQLKQKQKNVLAYNNFIFYSRKLWSRMIKYIQYQHFLSDFVYKIVNIYGLKTTFHFKFISTCINFYLFGTFLFLYPILKQLILYNDRISTEGISIFYLNYFEDGTGIFIYFNILLIVLATVLICMSFYRYQHYQKNSIIFEVQKAKGLKYFTMIFCEYNWKNPGQKSRLLFQLSLAKKVFSSFEEEDQVYRQLKYVNQVSQLFKNILFYIVYLGVIVCTGYFMLALNNNDILDKQLTSVSLFFNECILSGIAIAFIEVCSLFVTILIKILLHFEKSSQQQQSEYMKGFIYQALSYASFIFIRCSIIYKNDSIISSIVDTNYVQDGYQCPQQSSAQSLLTLYLMHYVFILYFKQYAKIIFSMFTKNDNYIKGDLKCIKDNKNRRQFKIVENTIPIIISNMIVLMNSPVNFAIYPISFILTFIFFFHNSQVLKQWKLPEYLTITSISTHGIIVMMFLFSLFLNFIHFFFISALQPPLFYYSDNPTKVCGPFTEEFTGILSYTFQYLMTQDGFQNFLDIIFWRPLLICIIVFFVIKSISNKKQYSKWLSILRYRSKEINAVKKHYKKKVSRLQKQLDSAAKDVKAIQKDQLVPQATQANTKQNPMLVSYELQQPAVNEQVNNSIDRVQSVESQGFHQSNNNFMRNRKRSSFANLANETNDFNNFITKPDSEF